MKFRKMLILTGLATVLALGTNNALAQGQGGGRNFDPAQMRQRMMERYREALEVKDDAEWKVIETQIGKVMDARMAIGFPGARGFMGGRNRDGGNNNRPNPFGGNSPAQEALQKAVDAKASSAEIKTKLEAYRADVKTKETKLDQAQEELKKLLTPQQEAAAVLNGLLK